MLRVRRSHTLPVLPLLGDWLRVSDARRVMSWRNAGRSITLYAIGIRVSRASALVDSSPVDIDVMVAQHERHAPMQHRR